MEMVREASNITTARTIKKNGYFATSAQINANYRTVPTDSQAPVVDPIKEYISKVKIKTAQSERKKRGKKRVKKQSAQAIAVEALEIV